MLYMYVVNIESGVDFAKWNLKFEILTLAFLSNFLQSREIEMKVFYQKKPYIRWYKWFLFCFKGTI